MATRAPVAGSPGDSTGSWLPFKGIECDPRPTKISPELNKIVQYERFLTSAPAYREQRKVFPTCLRQQVRD